MLYFDEPVIIEDGLEGNVRIWISHDIVPEYWSSEPTDIVDYNAYRITFGIDNDVTEGTILTMIILTSVTDLYGKELENKQLSVELTAKEIIV